MAYRLKQHITRQNHRFWAPVDAARVLQAPIYFFPDQVMFDSDSVERHAVATLSGRPLRLPHDHVIFEVPEYLHPGGSLVSVAATTERGIESHLFRFSVMRRVWSDVLVRILFRPDGFAEGALHPGITDVQQQDGYYQAATSLVFRALGLLAGAASLREHRVSQLRRRSLKGVGVEGWTYRIATIDPARLISPIAQGEGEHASPRWHIRRGHWRRLQDGREVFVRECEVGDIARGGVVKDYRIDLGSAA